MKADPPISAHSQCAEHPWPMQIVSLHIWAFLAASLHVKPDAPGAMSTPRICRVSPHSAFLLATASSPSRARTNLAMQSSACLMHCNLAARMLNIVHAQANTDEPYLSALNRSSTYLNAGIRSNFRAIVTIIAPTLSQDQTLEVAPKGHAKCDATCGTPLYLKATALAHLCHGSNGTLLNAESISSFHSAGFSPVTLQHVSNTPHCKHMHQVPSSKPPEE